MKVRRDISSGELQLDALDGLRGLAALIVVFSHTSNSSMFFFPYLDLKGIGKSGVFLFFLLSSFLLTRALIKKGVEAFSAASISLYAQRRFFRIYPLYIPYLLMALASSVLISVLGEQGVGLPFHLTFDEFLKHLFLIEGKGVTWSIAVEFKFYFLLPLLAFMMLWVKSRLGVISFVFFLVGLVVLTQVVSPQSESLRNDARLLPYMPIFIMGMALAFIQCEIESGRVKRKSLKLLVPAGYVSVVVLVFMTPLGAGIILGDLPRDYFHRYFIQYALLWSIVILSVVNFGSKMASVFSGRVLCFYGGISFSVYLFHPIFIKLAKVIGLPLEISAWVVLSLSTLAAYISFRILESPASKFQLEGWSLRASR